MCIMIYMPVCGCDGVMYSNYCLADCADVPWVPAIPSGQLGGFLPCSAWVPNQSLCEVEIVGDSILCGSNPIVLNTNNISGTPPFTYQWSNGQSNSSILTVTSPGNYCVTVTDSNGCVSTDCIFVSSLSINNGAIDVEICDGDTVVLEATNGFSTYSWALNGSTGSLLGNTYMVNATNPGLYTVVAIDSMNCVDIDSIEVIMYPAISLSPTTVPNPPMICLGDSLVIEIL